MSRSRLAPHLAVLLAVSCGPAPEPVEHAASPDLEDHWRAVLASPGGDLPFGLRIERRGDGLSAVAVHGEEEAPFSGVDVEGRQVTLRMDWYDSRIAALLDGESRRMEGEWSRTAAAGAVTRLPFSATRGDGRRFLPRAEAGLAPGAAAAVPSVDGSWAVEFHDEGGSEPARGEFRQEGNRVTGTFLTPTGDHRFLDGSYEDGLLRLSTFDGAHAYLFHARAREDGTLAGDFWSRDTYHATWTARRAEHDEEVLPDAWSLAGLRDADGRLDFTFPDLDGHAVSLADPRFRGKVVLVNLFGSWCPNCADEAPLLAEWHRRYRDRGFEIVGLAFEYTGDRERDTEMVRRYADRHGIEYPLLLAGTSDKAAASAALPDLTAVIAFPTTIFVDRAGRVRSIHSGFAGPGTGSHHEELVGELEGALEELLAQPAP